MLLTRAACDVLRPCWRRVAAAVMALLRWVKLSSRAFPAIFFVKIAHPSQHPCHPVTSDPLRLRCLLAACGNSRHTVWMARPRHNSGNVIEIDLRCLDAWLIAAITMWSAWPVCTCNRVVEDISTSPPARDARPVSRHKRPNCNREEGFSGISSDSEHAIAGYASLPHLNLTRSNGGANISSRPVRPS
jgi:hypothetical protein